MTTYPSFSSLATLSHQRQQQKLEQELKYHSSNKMMLPFHIIIIISVIVTACIRSSSAAYFSSVDSLRKLGDIELKLIQGCREYIDLQEKKLAYYRNFIEHVKEQHKVAEKDVEDYLGNAINAFTLIKRMVTDWNNLHELVMENEVRNVFRHKLGEITEQIQIPDVIELRGAIEGLMRLQKVYNLTAFDLANGLINDADYGSKLSWQDCFEIAINLFDEKELSLALTWFEVTLEQLHRAENNSIIEKFKIETLAYMALANYELSFPDKAIKCIDEILKIDPDHAAKITKTYIRLNLPKKLQSVGVATESYYANYTSLCSGVQIPEQVHHKLKCIIDARNNPGLLLAPLKIEELNFDPPVTLYHGILNEKQIENIIAAAENKMGPSTLYNGSGHSFGKERLVSQQAWLEYTSPTMRYIKNILTQITGLDLRFVGQMQVANYGIGGHYVPHYDYLGKGTSRGIRWIGDRIMTNMFYLSDVEQGGYTVFPRANILLRPEKGALVSWFNLHKSLDDDRRTLHAGCPVIKGSKRIGNVWIRSGFQEFKRPCELKRDHYKSFGYD